MHHITVECYRSHLINTETPQEASSQQQQLNMGPGQHGNQQPNNILQCAGFPKLLGFAATGCWLKQTAGLLAASDW